MPSPRLLACGMLSKYPEKSPILQRMLTTSSAAKFHSKAYKQHLTALYFTPGLPKSWIAWQLESRGKNPKTGMRKLRRVALNPENRRKWEYMGPRNLFFIGQPEVYYYYQRRDPRRRTWHPFWALPVFFDHIKEGMTHAEIEKMYGLAPGMVHKFLKTRSVTKDHGELRNKKNLKSWGK